MKKNSINVALSSASNCDSLDTLTYSTSYIISKNFKNNSINSIKTHDLSFLHFNLFSFLCQWFLRTIFILLFLRCVLRSTSERMNVCITKISIILPFSQTVTLRQIQFEYIFFAKVAASAIFRFNCKSNELTRCLFNVKMSHMCFPLFRISPAYIYNTSQLHV